MSRPRIARRASGCVVTLLVAAVAVAETGPVERDVAPDGITPLTLAGVTGRTYAYRTQGQVRRLFGAPLAYGGSPKASAAAFLAADATTLGVDEVDLVPGASFADGHHRQPIMYDAGRDRYRFTGFYYTQHRDGIPVFGTRLTLLVRNEPGHPVVLAAADLRDLGGFRVAPAPPPEGADAASWASTRAILPSLDRRDEPRTVIFAGTGDQPAAPVLARVFVAEGGAPDAADRERWRVVADAATGDVLHLEDLVVHADVTGSVSGMATEGDGADLCGPEVATPLPYAWVWIPFVGGTYADADGQFVLEDIGDGPVEVRSYMRGEWFDVNDLAGDESLLSIVVDPPGPAAFLHNEPNDGQLVRAQVNAYLHSNIVRDFVLGFNPDYPVITDQRLFDVNVNFDRNCNAFYDGNSINFYTSGGGCANTAFSTVVYHEYGHHLVAMAGSGQGAYGEGMSDVIGVLIADDPGLGYGFGNDCGRPLRRANNSCRYLASGCSTCGDEIHACGRLLSGCVWSTRNELRQTHPDDYREILSGLALNSILLHTGSSITPAITIDFLVLDDDNGVILDGTPHYDEIAAGFGAHDMDAPPISVCPADLDGSGLVDFGDLLEVLAAWGPCDWGCPEDFDGSRLIDFGDALYVLAAWGPCPR